MARTVTTGPTVAAKKPAAPRQKKVLAALSPTVASPEVMLPVVALDQVEAAMHPADWDSGGPEPQVPPQPG